jgi:two-component sensor histidine kinase
VCWFVEQAYSADSWTPTQARRLAADRLHQALGADAAAEELVDIAGLVISELVTNAVNAGATMITVDLAIHRDHVRAGVADDAAGSPIVRTPTLHATGGRGLRILDQLVRSWGVRPTASGKQIWAEFFVDPAATAALSCTV